MAKKKFDCWTCKHKGTVPGSAHICCNHPDLKKITEDNPMLELMSIFASVGRAPPVVVHPPGFNIKGNPQGIKGGWFNWPMNYDPIWLMNCDKCEKTKNG